MKNICLFAVLMFISSGQINAQSTKYHLIKTFPIKSSGKWDYLAVSPVAPELYVSHGTHVNILDKMTGDSLGIINNTEGVHGIAFAPSFGKGYTSNGKMNTVSVFNLKDHVVTDQVKTGDNPDAIVFDPFSKMIYVCNGHSKDLTVIDPSNNSVIKTIQLGGKPETAVSNEAGRLFINIEDKNEVAVLNTKSLVVEHNWKTGKGDEPSGLAIDLKARRLFIGCGNKLMVVMNAENGKIVKELPIGDGCDGVAFDKGTGTAFSSNGDGTLTVVRQKSKDNYVVAENVKTKPGARTIAVDEATHLVYLPTAEFEPNPPANVAAKKRNTIPGTFQVMVIGK